MNVNLQVNTIANMRLFTLKNIVCRKMTQHYICYIVYPIFYNAFTVFILLVSLASSLTSFFTVSIYIRAIFSFLVFFLTLLKLYLNYNLKSIDHHYLAIWYSTICKRIMYQHYRSQVSELTHEKWITFYSKFDKDCKIMADKKCPPFVTNITQKFMGGTSDVFITCIQLFVQSQLCPVKHTFVDILACSSTPLMQLIDEIEKIKTMHIADIMSLSELMKLDKITIIHLLFIEWNVSREIIKTIVKPHIKTPFPFKILSTSPLFFLFYTTWHEYFLRYAINFNEVTREHLYKMTSFEFENVYTFANASLGYDSHIDFRLSVDCDTASVSKIKIVVDEDSL